MNRELIRKAVRATVADGEVRKVFQVHLCVVRESKDVEENKKLSYKTTVREWITGCPPPPQVAQANAERRALCT